MEPVHLEVTSSLAGDGAEVALEWTSVPGASVYSVIRGGVRGVSVMGSYTILHDVVCAGRSVVQPALRDPILQEDPNLGDAFYYLVGYFDGSFSGYGTEPGEREVVIPAGDPCR